MSPGTNTRVSEDPINGGHWHHRQYLYPPTLPQDVPLQKRTSRTTARSDPVATTSTSTVIEEAAAPELGVTAPSPWWVLSPTNTLRYMCP